MPEITLEQSKAIIDKGIEYGAWSWDDGIEVTDDVIASTAIMLLEASAQAGAKGSVNDAVLEILHAGQVEPTSEQSRAAYAQRFNVQLTAAPAPTTAADPPTASGGAFAQPTPEDSARAADTDADTPGDMVNIESIFPGYDDMKVKQIKDAVLGSAASGDLSPEEWEQIKIYEAANEERKTILSLEPEFKAPEPEPATAPSGAFGDQQTVTVTPAPDGSSQTVVFTSSGAPPDNGEGIGAFYNGETISRAQQEGLPVPPQTTGEGVVMPIDITNTSDQELSRLATAYHSLFARAQWLISQEEGRERAAEQLEHDAHRDAYIHAYENHKGSIPEGKSGPTALDSARKLAEKDADGAEPVHTWRTRKIRHGIDARELKALATGYDKGVWRINEELERRARLATSSGAVR